MIVKTFEQSEKNNVKIAKNTHYFDNKKVSESLSIIKKKIEKNKNPVVLCSFGKDSLVMLHLILQIKKIPVIYWREPYFQSKFKHPQNVAQLWDLTLYDYPPTFTDYIQIDDYFDVYNFYYVNSKNYITLYTGTRKYNSNDKKILCALSDLLYRPKVPSYDFKWDCVFHGHKQCDPVYITDKIKIPESIYLGNVEMVMPIKNWSNENIWSYINKHNLPYNKKRYDKVDELSNNDIFPTCHDCLDYRNKNKCIICPKTKQQVKYIGKSKEDNFKFKDFLINISYKKGA